MTTATHNTEYDFQVSHLVEGGIALFALGLTVGSLDRKSTRLNSSH